MSKDENNLPVEVPTSDLSPSDIGRIEKYFANGARGFNLSDETTITKMMDLYLTGKTYSQIARITRQPKELVMAYSQQLNWYPLKMEYLGELQANMRGRLVAAKAENQDFLLQLAQMWQKKLGKHMDEYMKTGNEEHAEKISSKDLDKYLKTIKTLAEMSSEGSGRGDKPLIGMNVGEGVTVEKKDDGTVEITPKQKTMGSMLEVLANKRREAEAAKTATSSDIKEVTPIETKQSEGDKGEKQ